MKFVLNCLLFALSLQALAMDDIRSSCPKTRSCKADKDCRIYAFKHNCHAQCQKISLKQAGQTTQECSPKCLCLKKVELINA